MEKLKKSLQEINNQGAPDYDEMENAILFSDISLFDKGYLCGKISVWNGMGQSVAEIIENVIESLDFLPPKSKLTPKEK